MKEAVASI